MVLIGFADVRFSLLRRDNTKVLRGSRRVEHSLEDKVAAVIYRIPISSVAGNPVSGLTSGRRWIQT